MPVVSSSSPPESQGVGSSSSEMWTHRIGCPAPSAPATSSRPHSLTRLPTVSIRGSRRLGHLRSPVRPPRREFVEPLPGLGQHGAQHVFDLLEMLGVAD